jgi:hypothetical protein
VACRRGGRCCGGGCVISFISFVFVHSAPVVFVTWCSFMYPPLPSPSCDVAISTRDPPCEQWPAGLGAGAGLCGVLSCILPSPHRRATWPLAPTIHPVSSGLQGSGQVLGCHLFRGVHCVVFVAWHSFLHPPLPSLSCDVAVSTHDPPCKQWLAGLGQVLGCTSSSILHAPHFHPTSSCSRRQLGLLWWLSFRLMCFVSWGWLQRGRGCLPHG